MSQSSPGVDSRESWTDALPIGVCRLDRELLVIDCNRCFREMLDLPGLAAGDLLPRRLAQAEQRELTGPVPTEHLDDRSEEWLEWLSADATAAREIVLQGEPFRLRIAQAEMGELVLTGESCAELRRAEQARIESEQRLERKEAELSQAHKMELIGQLSGGLAHDFKNLLTVVLGSLEFVQSSPEATGETLRHLSAAVDAAESGAELTRRLQAVGRKQTLRPTSVDLADVLAKMSELLKHTLPETIRLRTECGEGPLIANVDRSQLDNSLLNLAINSRDAMAHGGKLTLRAERVPQQPGAPWPGRLRIAVIDEGEGMEPSVLERSVEPFFTTKSESNGTGLGLSMVHGFARQSGGELTIDSRIGEGTTVLLELPASHRSVEVQVEGKAAPVELSPQRVLLAEDSEPVRLIVTEMLEKLGHQVVATETYEAAVEALERDAFDMVITDVVLSGPRNGYQLAHALLRQSPGLKLIFMSGYQRRSRHRDSPLDRAPMLEKPFMIDDLSRAIDSAIAVEP